jgi:hypothetical protein
MQVNMHDKAKPRVIRELVVTVLFQMLNQHKKMVLETAIIDGWIPECMFAME